LPKPKPPPVAAGCGAHGRHTVRQDFLLIQPVSQEALIGAIKQCLQTLWAGGKLSPLAAL